MPPMHDGLIQTANSSQGDNLGKSRDMALDCRVRAYDIPSKARGLARGSGSI